MAQTLIYAGRPERLLAYLIDKLVLFFTAQLLMMLAGVGILAVFLIFLSQIFYHLYFTAGNWQATPAQRLLGIHVAHADGGRAPLRDVMERVLVFIMPELPLYTSLLVTDDKITLATALFFLWFAPILFTAQRTGLHDYLSTTRVVVGKA